MLMFSCNTKNGKNNLCVNKIIYISQKQQLVPSVIKIKIDGDDGSILSKIQKNELKNVILLSIKKEYRVFFVPLKSFKDFEVPVTITLVTGFFDENKSFDKDLKKIHEWKQKEIEDAINGDVALIFKNDTIIIKNCKTPPRKVSRL